MGIEQRGVVKAAPVGTHAVALHHELGGAFGRDRQPDRGCNQVHRHRDLVHSCTELPEQLRPRLDLGIDVGL
jgi:hypothetical protein